MRVLWFTNIPMPAVDRRTGRPTLGSGHWMKVLLQVLRRRGTETLGVVTAYPRLPDLEFEDDGVRYWTIGQPRLLSQLACREVDLQRCQAIARQFAPDVIHVHGSERLYGLLEARRLVEAPVVISLQGFLSACLPTFFGSLGARELLAATRAVELATRRGLAWDYLDFRRGTRHEAEILSGARAFAGRTAWDLAQVRARNPEAVYHRVGELLRPDFADRSWGLAGCQRDRIFLTNVGHPRRGAETVLEAAAVLSRRRPGLRLAFAGSVAQRTGYGRWLRERIRRLGLQDRVELLGFLDGPSLARELAASHAFVIASYEENSPNSLCEAMRVGLPCVAAYTGGIPSLVEEGRTGLLFPPGDAAMLAARLEEVLGDDALATRLGEAARAEATRRHDPEFVVGQLIDAYRAVVAGARSRASNTPC